MGDDTNKNAQEIVEENYDSSCRLYSLSLDLPLRLPISSDQASGKTMKELKAWIWKNHAQQIIQSLRLDAVISDVAPESSGKHYQNHNRNDFMKDEEEKDEETNGSHILRQPPPTNQNRCGASIALYGSILPNNRENLLDTIAHVQRQFFQSVAPREVFGGLLEGLLDLMSSEYGFIGEIKYEDDGTMYLQTHAITNIAWNQSTRQFYEDNIESGT
jgi:hypothetical protein